MQQIEAIGVERDLAGMPVINLPASADLTDSSTSDLGKARKIVRNIRRDQQEGVTLPFEWELELLSTGGSRQLNVDGIIQRYESRILMSALAQFLILGQNGVGTQALRQDMSELFDLAVNSICDTIGDVMTKYAIPRLLELNGMDAEGIALTHTPAGNVDLAALGSFMQQVSDKLTWTAQDEVWLRGIASLPELDEETIEEERERKKEEQQAMFERRQPFEQSQQQRNQERDQETEREDNAATLFAADGKAAGDAERMRYERLLYRKELAYLNQLQRKILAQARKLR